MSIKQVNRTLDVPIHDIYHMSEKGTLMEFTYLQPVRKVGQSVNVYENPTEGETKYVQPQKMFVAFKDGKMTSMISQNGVSRSADITFQHEIIKLMMEDESLKKIMMEGNYPPVMQETQAAPNQMPSAMQKNASSDETESSGMSFWDILLN